MNDRESLEEVSGKLDSIERQLEGLRRFVLETHEGMRSSLEVMGGLVQLVQDFHKELMQLRFDAHSIKDSANIALRYQSKNKRIKCLFLVNVMEMWDSLAGIYAAMSKDQRFEPIVVTTFFRPLGQGNYEGEGVVSEALTKKNIPHLRLDMLNYDQGLTILKNLTPDIIFRQQPWDSNILPGYSARELSFARLCFVPYFFASLVYQRDYGTEDIKEHSGFDLDYHRECWRIFCDSNMTERSFKSFRHIDPQKIIISGPPKLDYILSCKNNGVWPFPKQDKKCFKIVWAAHHSVDSHSSCFSVFLDLYEDMLFWARNTPEIQFVLQPHPALQDGVIRSGHMTGGQFDRYLALWSGLENCTVYTGDYVGLFAASDLMITDGVSFLAEYPLFDKPLIFVDSRRHYPFNELGEMAVACARTVTSFTEIKEAVEEWQTGHIWDREQERQKLLQALRAGGRSAVEIILDAIVDGMKETT
ncbi:CDP-glycerol glycerophosphotransferase family protein [Acetobacteraceae bacterium ESL0709]|nr:CDP-glycerol glycerophosphotransferase family protein [Acetobacteraceae bacterium ESL0697]MDF7677508.1 CDP-glycerol glycerophosphotransferase family protein [Acetobacteraceae bacterium ESL0709]